MIIIQLITFLINFNTFVSKIHLASFFVSQLSIAFSHLASLLSAPNNKITQKQNKIKTKQR